MFLYPVILRFNTRSLANWRKGRIRPSRESPLLQIPRQRPCYPLPGSERVSIIIIPRQAGKENVNVLPVSLAMGNEAGAKQAGDGGDGGRRLKGAICREGKEGSQFVEAAPHQGCSWGLLLDA